MKAVIYCCSTDGRDGHVQDGDGKTRVYSDLAEASAAAKRLEERMNGPLAKITFTYLPMEITDCCGASVKGSADSETGLVCRSCYRDIYDSQEATFTVML